MKREKKIFKGKGNIFSDNTSVDLTPPSIPQVPLYDKNGRQITGQADIEAEIERRRAEWRNTHGGREPLSGVDLTPPSIPQVPLYDKNGRQITGQADIEAEIERRRAEWRNTHGGREPLSSVDLTPPSIPQVPLYDKNGRQITGQADIEAEIERRRAEWEQWKEQGLVESGEEEFYQTSEGGYISISSQVVKDSNLGSNAIKDSERFAEIEESNPKNSRTTSQQNKKSLHELEEELTYLKSLPDEKGYLRKNIQDLERQIVDLKQQQDFTQHHQIPPKK